MIRDIPIIPTIVVALAVATMIALGIWQLGRAEEKRAMIAEYEAASASNDKLVSLPRNDHSGRWHLFRKIDVSCDRVEDWRTTAGRNTSDQSGFVHIAQCLDNATFAFDAPQPMFEIALGWSRSPEEPRWNGGDITGRVVSAGEIPKVQADEPLEGLQALAEPDPKNLPNNHIAYAGQWFFFALTALVIYVLALRRRRRTSGD